MISDVTFDLAGSSAVAAVSPNGWHLAVVRHGVAIDFFDARDLCSSTSSSSSFADPTSTNHKGGAGGGGDHNNNKSTAQQNATTNRASQRSRQRKLGALQGSFATVDDVSTLVWSPDSTLLAACMVSRGIISVISTISFQSIATIEGALNGTCAHVLWHPSSRALYWFGLAQTHVVSLTDGHTMILDYHAKVVVDATSDAASAGSTENVSLPYWQKTDPCPAHTTAGATSPSAVRPLVCFSNGDGSAAREYAAVRDQQQQQEKKHQHHQNSKSNNAAPPLFICMVSPCSVAAAPPVPTLRGGMTQQQDSNNNNNNPSSVLINTTSAQSVASTTNVLEEAAGVAGAPYNSKLSITTEFFHVFSAVTHELIFSFPIRTTAASSSSSNAKSSSSSLVDTGCEFSVTSFHVSPSFVVFHDLYSSALAVFSHRGENIGPNKKDVVAYSVTSADSVDGGCSLAVVHAKSCVSVFCSLFGGGGSAAATSSSSPLVQLYSVNLAKPQTYHFSASASTASAGLSSPLVVLAERIAADDLLERARNEPVTERAAAAHRADPSRVLPPAPANRSLYEVLWPSSSGGAAPANGTDMMEADERQLMMMMASSKNEDGDQHQVLYDEFSSIRALTLVPGLRSKSLDGLCHDPKSRDMIESFVRQTMRRTGVRNMMDDVFSSSSSSSSSCANKNNRRGSGGGAGGDNSKTMMKVGINSPAGSTTGQHNYYNNLHLLSADVLAEIAPIGFQHYGYCAMTSFHCRSEHTSQLYVAVVVPAFPTCVWVIDAAQGRVISCMQQQHVVTTLTWKPPREVLPAHQQQQQHHPPGYYLNDPILAFATDSHLGCLYLWTPDSALCIAMPEIAKVAAHNNNNKSAAQKLLQQRSENTANSEPFQCKMHVACSNPDCKRNWLERQKEVTKKRAMERGELGGFRTTCTAWTDAGNALLLIDTVRGAHTVATMIPSAE